jgi:hypothetical protein
MCGVGALYWYPKRKPSEEMRRTTGFGSLASGRAVTVAAERGGARMRRNAVAAARAAVRRSRRRGAA